MRNCIRCECQLPDDYPKRDDGNHIDIYECLVGLKKKVNSCKAAHGSLKGELSRIFGPIDLKDIKRGETWTCAMLRRITEKLVDLEK